MYCLSPGYTIQTAGLKQMLRYSTNHIWYREQLYGFNTCSTLHWVGSVALLILKKQPPAAQVPAPTDQFVEVTSLGTSFTSERSGLHLPWGYLDFIYLREVSTSFTSGMSGLHLPQGGLDFIYLGDVWTSFTSGRSGLHLPRGGLDFIYLREVWTSFTLGRS